MNLGDDDAEAVAAAAIALCTKRPAIYLTDPPSSGGKRDTVTGIMSWLDANDPPLSRNAALYFPRTDVADACSTTSVRARSRQAA